MWKKPPPRSKKQVDWGMEDGKGPRRSRKHSPKSVREKLLKGKIGLFYLVFGELLVIILY